MTDEAHPLSLVRIPDNCGNAPRKIIVRDFLIALYSRNSFDVTEMLTPNICWEIVGVSSLDGIDSVRDWLLAETAPTELHINTIITHGRESGADGNIVFANGTVLRFCHMLMFAGAAKSAKITEIRSFCILMCH